MGIARLRLSGKPLDLFPVPPVLKRLIELLNKSGVNDLWTSSDLVRMLRVSRSAFDHAVGDEKLSRYKARSGSAWIYGNPRAILKYRKATCETR